MKSSSGPLGPCPTPCLSPEHSQEKGGVSWAETEESPLVS